MVHCWQRLADQKERGDTHRRWDSVVGGLRHVDVIVGVDQLRIAALAAENLDGAVGEDLVGVHVMRGACARLIDIHDEVLLPVARQRCAEMVTPVLAKDLVARLDDRVGYTRIEPPSVAVGHRGGALDEHRGAHKCRVRAHPADRVVLDRTLRLRAVERLGRDLHRAERVFFDADIFRRLIGIWHNVCASWSVVARGLSVGDQTLRFYHRRHMSRGLFGRRTPSSRANESVYAPCWLIILKSRAWPGPYQPPVTLNMTLFTPAGTGVR